MSELITGVKTPEQIQAMREGGKILARVLPISADLCMLGKQNAK